MLRRVATVNAGSTCERRLIRRSLLISDSLVSRAVTWKAKGPGSNPDLVSSLIIFLKKSQRVLGSLSEGTPLIYTWIIYCYNRKMIQEFFIQFNPLYQPSADVIPIIRLCIYRVTHFNLSIEIFQIL